MKQELEHDQGLPPFLRRHWRAMALAFTVVLLAGVASYPFLPRKYTSQAKLMIVRADQRMGGAKVIEDDVPELTGASHPLYTQAQILQIQSVLENAIKGHDLKGEGGRPLSIGELDAGYGVFPVKGTDVIDLTMISDRPERAHERLEALCESYFEHIQKYRKEGVREGLNYLEEQLQLAKKQLEESEDRLQAFKRVSGSISLPSEIEAAVRDYSDVNSTIRAQRLALESAQARAEGLRGKLGMSTKDALDFAAIAQNPRLKFLQEQLLAVETSPVRNRGLKPDHPEMRALTQREGMLRQEMSEEIKRLIGRNLPFRALDDIRLEALRQLTSAQTEILSLQAAVSAAEKSRTRLADGMTSIPERERKLVGLKRDVEVAGQVYQQLLQKRSEARLSLANNLAYAYLLEAPTMPDRPSYPLFKHLLLFLVAMGVTVSFGTGLLLEFIDQVRRVGPSLPQVPLIATLPLLSRAERRDGELLARTKPFSHYLQSIKMLALALEEQRREGKQIIALTSLTAGEGKTVTVANLAWCLAEAGNRVLLIDGDIFHPRLPEIFGLPFGPGLCEALQEREAVSQEAIETVGPLDFLQAGTSEFRPTLADLKRGLGFLEEWRQYYDFILIDLSPYQMAPEVSQFARASDGLLFLANLQKTSLNDVAEVLPQLRSLRIPILGMVSIQTMLVPKSYYLLGEGGLA